ncbi:hypothetical protein [Nostoc sp. PCC 7107]|nr:hypothetical protein [Nostoc sp. PCC 7107]
MVQSVDHLDSQHGLPPNQLGYCYVRTKAIAFFFPINTQRED